MRNICSSIGVRISVTIYPYLKSWAIDKYGFDNSLKKSLAVKRLAVKKYGFENAFQKV